MKIPEFPEDNRPIGGGMKIPEFADERPIGGGMKMIPEFPDENAPVQKQAVAKKPVLGKGSKKPGKNPPPAAQNSEPNQEEAKVMQ